jgi:hypothetical protein
MAIITYAKLADVSPTQLGRRRLTWKTEFGIRPPRIRMALSGDTDGQTLAIASSSSPRHAAAGVDHWHNPMGR